MRTAKRLSMMLLALVALSACGPSLSSFRVSEGGETTAATVNVPDEQRGPRIANGDTLRVTVFNEPQLSGDFVVGKSGSIAFPLIGQTNVVGLDTLEIEQLLKRQLDGRFLVNPKVGVELMNQRPFYIMGEVTKAGEYPYRPGLNVVGAIATAGGFSPRAQTDRVSIRRNGETRPQDYPVQPNVPVYPGDMITIPERLF